MVTNNPTIKLGTPQRDAPVTCLQDCALIAQTFERAAHYDMKEESVFAPLYRHLETTKGFSAVAQQSLQGYLISPTSTSVADLQELTKDVVNVGTSEVPGGSLTSLSIGEGTSDFMSDLLGESVMDRIRDCIPCGGRILSLLELHPSLDFIGVLRADVMARLKFISDIISLLKNFDIYADYCLFLNILGEMCIPDLQRLLLMFAALIMDLMPKQDQHGGMLRGLIGPIFMPILAQLTALLDQFALVILSPIDCVIDHINAQIHKLFIELDPQNPLQEMSNGLAELNKAIEEGKAKIQEKLEFYIGQAKKLIQEEMLTSQMYLEISLKKLNYIRLIAFVVAIILALSKGQLACTKQGESPQQSEIENFFTNFLNPNIPHTFRVNPDGQLFIDEQYPGYEDVYRDQPIIGSQVDIDGQEISALPSSIAARVTELSSALSSPVQLAVPCKLKTTPGESGKIERWIQMLNEEGN